MRKNQLAFVLILVLIVLLVVYGAYKLMNSRTVQLVGSIVNHIDTEKKLVALTFDDGPTNNVEALLPLLEEYDAKATFFLIGSELEQNMELGEAIADAGHQIGNHTYSHKRMVFKLPSYIKEEIESTDSLIRDTGFEGEIDFRPPYGKKLIGLPIFLEKNNRETITWNLEPDKFYQSAKDKIQYVKENITPGSIILLHPMYDKTGEEWNTTEGILDALSKDGYIFVTVNELQEAGS